MSDRNLHGESNYFYDELQPSPTRKSRPSTKHPWRSASGDRASSSSYPRLPSMVDSSEGSHNRHGASRSLASSEGRTSRGVSGKTSFLSTSSDDAMSKAVSQCTGATKSMTGEFSVEERSFERQRESLHSRSPVPSNRRYYSSRGETKASSTRPREQSPRHLEMQSLHSCDERVPTSSENTSTRHTPRSRSSEERPSSPTGTSVIVPSNPPSCTSDLGVSSHSLKQGSRGRISEKESPRQSHKDSDRVARIANWLADEVIGNDADMEEMRIYAQKFVNDGFHSVEIIQQTCSVGDVMVFMKKAHQRRFLARSQKYDQSIRQRQISVIADWLAKDVIGYDADLVTMDSYAERFLDDGFHSVEMIQDICSESDIIGWKRAHKRLFLAKAGLKKNHLHTR